MRKIEAWQTIDNKVFETQVEAAEHEFRIYAVELFGVSAVEMMLSSSAIDELHHRLGAIIAIRQSVPAPIRPPLGQLVQAPVGWPPAGMNADADDTTIAGDRIVATTFAPPVDERFDVEGQRVIAAGGVLAIAERREAGLPDGLAPIEVVGPRVAVPMGVGTFEISPAIADDPAHMELLRAAVHIIGEVVTTANGFRFFARSTYFRHVVLKAGDSIPNYDVVFHKQSNGALGVQFVEKAIAA